MHQVTSLLQNSPLTCNSTSTLGSTSATETDSSKDHQANVTHDPNQADKDVVIVAHTKAKKRRAGTLPVKSAILKKDVALLLPGIWNGEWLSDENVHHVEAMLAKQFNYIGGLQTVYMLVLLNRILYKS